MGAPDGRNSASPGQKEHDCQNNGAIAQRQGAGPIAAPAALG
jgi:hypothetical protein